MDLLTYNNEREANELPIGCKITLGDLAQTVDVPFCNFCPDATGQYCGEGAFATPGSADERDVWNVWFKFDPKDWANESTIVTITEIELI